MADDDKGTDTTTGADTTTDSKTTDTIVDVTKTATDTTDTKTADDTTKTTDAPDWRIKLAGDDKEFLKRLGRFSDEAAFAKSYRSLETKLSSGEFKRNLPEGATPEEVATWRKENGVPDKPEGYLEKLELPNGLVVGEADKPIVAEFAAAALESNMDPKQLSGLVAKYYAIQDAQQAQRDDDDAKFKTDSEEALRADWQGADFRRNLTAVNNLIATFPGDLSTNLLAARTPEGRKLGDDPTFIKQLAQLARELNPLAPLVPAGTTDAGKTAQGELDEIRKYAREKPEEYNADKKIQARRLELTEALQKHASRNAA